MDHQSRGWLIATRGMYAYLAICALRVFGLSWTSAAVAVVVLCGVFLFALRYVLKARHEACSHLNDALFFFVHSRLTDAMSVQNHYLPGVGAFGATLSVRVRPAFSSIPSSDPEGEGLGLVWGATPGAGEHKPLVTLQLSAPSVTLRVLGSAAEQAPFLRSSPAAPASPPPSASAAPSALPAPAIDAGSSLATQSKKVRVVRWVLRNVFPRLSVRLRAASVHLHTPASAASPALSLYGIGFTVAFSLGSAADASALLHTNVQKLLRVTLSLDPVSVRLPHAHAQALGGAAPSNKKQVAAADEWESGTVCRFEGAQLSVNAALYVMGKGQWFCTSTHSSFFFAVTAFVVWISHVCWNLRPCPHSLPPPPHRCASRTSPCPFPVLACACLCLTSRPSKRCSPPSPHRHLPPPQPLSLLLALALSLRLPLRLSHGLLKRPRQRLHCRCGGKDSWRCHLRFDSNYVLLFCFVACLFCRFSSAMMCCFVLRRRR
jgi:hypothetical protein